MKSFLWQAIGNWLKTAKNKNKLLFPPLAPNVLQEMVANDPLLQQKPGHSTSHSVQSL